jgi:GTP-dependent phosphoenolpyruvate carboxykinase
MDFKKLIIVPFIAVSLFAQKDAEPAKQPVFKVSAEEQMNVDNLKLKKENLLLQIQIANMQFRAAVESTVNFILASHNSPANVKFDFDKMEFVVSEPEVAKPAATPDKAKK